jgi:hypothetical protein
MEPTTFFISFSNASVFEGCVCCRVLERNVTCFLV